MSELVLPDQSVAVAGVRTTAGRINAARRRDASSSVLSPGARGMIVVFSEIPGLTRSGVLEQPFVFQCPPIGDFTPQYQWNWDDFGTIDSGMHSIPNWPQLMSLTFRALFVDNDHEWPFVVSPGQEPMQAVKKLRELGDSMSAFQMQAGVPYYWREWHPLGRNGQAAIGVTLRQLTMDNVGGEGDSIYADVTVAEFADTPDLLAVPVKMPTAGTTHRGPHTQAATGQKVLAVLDTMALEPRLRTLRAIAKEYYGSVTGVPAIQKASGLTDVPASADLRVYLGGRHPVPKITIPKLPSRSARPVRK